MKINVSLDETKENEVEIFVKTNTEVTSGEPFSEILYCMMKNVARRSSDMGGLANDSM